MLVLFVYSFFLNIEGFLNMDFVILMPEALGLQNPEFPAQHGNMLEEAGLIQGQAEIFFIFILWDPRYSTE